MDSILNSQNINIIKHKNKESLEDFEEDLKVDYDIEHRKESMNF